MRKQWLIRGGGGELAGWVQFKKELIYSISRDESGKEVIHPASKKNPPPSCWLWKTAISREGSVACGWEDYDEEKYLKGVFTFLFYNVNNRDVI